MSNTISVKAGKVILKSGEMGKGFYILKSGVLEITKGNRTISEMKTPGGIFGEMSELLAKPRYCGVRAQTDATIMHVDKSLEALGRTNPDILLKLIKTLARRLDQTTAMIPYQADDDEIASRTDPRVLLVEDKDNMAEQIQEGLKHTNWELIVAKSADRALEMIELDHFDLFVISLALPNEHALSLRRALKANKRSSDTPMIATVVKSDQEALDKARQYGFNKIVTKPIDFFVMESTMAKTMNLDISGHFFESTNEYQMFKLPVEVTEMIAESINEFLEKKLMDTVNEGLSKVIIQTEALGNVDVISSDIVARAIEICEKLDLKFSAISSPEKLEEWKKFEKTKTVEFVEAIEDAKKALSIEEKENSES